MIRLAHITDPHLPLAGARPGELASKRILGWLSWRLRRWRNHKREVLDLVMADIAASGARHVALSGDLTNIATRAEFARARKWLAGIAEPGKLTFVPGNHDCYVADAAQAGLASLAPWMTGVAEEKALPEFPTVRYLGNVALIGVNSSYPAPWGEASGRVGGKQLKALAGLLSSCAAKGLCRVVLIHHPPLAELATKPRKALKDAGALKDILKTHGAEAVLYGHNHLWAHDVLETATGRAHLLAAPSASMAAGRSKPPGGWQILSISRAQGVWNITVERRGLSGDGKGIVPLETLRLNSRD